VVLIIERLGAKKRGGGIFVRKGAWPLSSSSPRDTPRTPFSLALYSLSSSSSFETSTCGSICTNPSNFHHIQLVKSTNWTFSTSWCKIWAKHWRSHHVFGGSEHWIKAQTLVKGWPCNFVSSGFESSINWVQFATPNTHRKIKSVSESLGRIRVRFCVG